MNLYWSLAVAIVCFFAGWHTHTWYDGYKTKTQAVVAEQRAASGETKIIHDTQVITKVITHEKNSPCLSQPLPSDLAKQLR